MSRSKINCEEVLEHLFAYLDGELDAQRQALIAEHLHACRGCFSRAEFERRLKARLTEAGEEKAPDTLVRRVQSLIARF